MSYDNYRRWDSIFSRLSHRVIGLDSGDMRDYDDFRREILETLLCIASDFRDGNLTETEYVALSCQAVTLDQSTLIYFEKYHGI